MPKAKSLSKTTAPSLPKTTAPSLSKTTAPSLSKTTTPRPSKTAAPRADILKLKVHDADGAYRLEDWQMSESVGYLLKRSFALLSAAIDEDLSPYDLTHPQFAILMMLKERNCTTAAELAREMCGDTGAITRMLDRLEAKQILRRVRSSEDRRVVNIELTDTGKLVVQRMPVVAINVLNRYLKNFDAREVTALKQLLGKLISEIETVAATPPEAINKSIGKARRKPA